MITTAESLPHTHSFNQQTGEQLCCDAYDHRNHLQKAIGRKIKGIYGRYGSHTDEEYPYALIIEFEDGTSLYLDCQDHGDHVNELLVLFRKEGE